MIKIIESDILKSNSQFIAHQCNLKSNYARGVAEVIFNKYPAANDYKTRSKNSDAWEKMGSVICHKVEDGKFIINMFAQVFPGKASTSKDSPDSTDNREFAFKTCLNKIPKVISSYNVVKPSISFPFGIGCGLAGGNWNRYYNMLEEFEEMFSGHYGGEVVLCKIQK